MCKVFAMTDMTEVPTKDLPKLIHAARDAVCALGDRDGFGWSVMGNGSMYTERTLKPFNYRYGTSKALPFCKSNVEKTGVMPKVLGSFIAHGRMSTNDICIENTHPFVSDDNKISLIHNGVVRSADTTLRLRTTCDSEILLRCFERGGIADIEKNVTGYYAMAILDAHKSTMHIIRDSRAELYIAWCKEAQSYLIATTEVILYSVAKSMQWTINAPQAIDDNTHIKFKGNTYTWNNIQPKEDTALNNLASKAFGEYDKYQDSVTTLCTECRFDVYECICEEYGKIDAYEYMKGRKQ